MNFKGMGKYREVVVSIALFIVFDAAVLVMNFYIASQFAEDAKVVNLAGRQRTLAQTTVKALLQTDNALGSGDYIDEPLAELKESALLFDSTLTAFSEGGMVEGLDGRQVALSAATSSYNIALLAESREVWASLWQALEPILAFDARIDLSAELVMSEDAARLEGDLYEAISVASASKAGARLTETMNRLAISLENEAGTRVMRLRIIQVTGICLALINFFVILFHFLRNLRDSDARLAKSRQQTNDILETVNEGLFLLDRDFNIGSRYSRHLSEIFRRDDFAGLSFLSLMRDIVPETTLNVARDYIGLFFADRVNENLVDDLNPLSEVEVHFGDSSGIYQSRYLGFSFRRVVEGSSLSHLLVTVNDITDRVALTRELEESQEKSKEQMDMLMDILHIEPEILTDFLCESEKALARVNALLQKRGRDSDSFRAKLDGIFREVHALKGEAGALGLPSVQRLAHELEEVIVGIREKQVLDGNDFLPLAIKLDDILKHINAVRDLVGKLVDFRSAMGTPSAPDAERRTANRTNTSQMLQKLTDQLASDNGKRVAFMSSGLDSDSMPSEYRKPIKDIAVQFVRNGVTHGIEVPSERLAAQKSQDGMISLSFTDLGAAGYELSYRDDGRGLDPDRIRQAAIDKGFVNADEVENMDQRTVYALIFKRGFSTSDVVSNDAGRGVGMDVIRNIVNALNGRVRIATSRGEFTQFRISLPAIPRDVSKAA